jgi:uncharacterized membrane protein YkvA (DUF1232 family)
MGRHDLKLLWYALSHPSRPVWLLPVAAGLVFYAIEPLNLALPMVGVVDDLILLPLLLHGVVLLLPAAIRGGYDERRGSI